MNKLKISECLWIQQSTEVAGMSAAPKSGETCTWRVTGKIFPDGPGTPGDITGRHLDGNLMNCWRLSMDMPESRNCSLREIPILS